MVFEYLKEAYENQEYLNIVSKNNRKFKIKVKNVANNMVDYTFENGKDGHIFIENIKEISFASEITEKSFYKKRTEKNVLDYCDYYLNIMKKEYKKAKKKDSSVEENQLKNDLYEHLFLHLPKENLLYKFINCDNEEGKTGVDITVPLLVEQSNASQKKAIKNAMENTITVIEGPPGCGKTTTILSLIANLIYNGKHVIVVSKNNSAVDNIIEEFAKKTFLNFIFVLEEQKIT